MSNINNLEKIESTLLQPARFLSLKNAVTLGKKNKSGSKLDPIYVSTYESQKYVNHKYLQGIYVNSSDYFVVSYSNKNTFEEIYMSYPHIHKFDKMIKGLIKIIKDGMPKFNNNKPFIYRDNELYFNQEYKDVIINVKNLIGGKSISAYLDVINVGDNYREGYDRGVVMLINDQDNVVELSLDALESISYFMDRFSLLNSSQNLILMALNESIKLEDENKQQQSMPPKNTPIIRRNNNFEERPVRRRRNTNNLIENINEVTDTNLSDELNEFLLEEEEIKIEEPIVKSNNKIESSIDEVDSIINEIEDETPTIKPESKPKEEPKKEDNKKDNMLNTNFDDIISNLDNDFDFDMGE